MMRSLARWRIAQNYEREFWRRAERRRPASRQSFKLGWYSWASSELSQRVEGLIEKNADTRILEVGAGPAGVIAYLGWGVRVALDPLAPFFQEYRRDASLDTKGIHFCAAMGEHLPLRSRSFRLVIMHNVLDHCSDPNKVLSEVKRVLEEDGLFDFMVYIRTRWGRLVRGVMELFHIDRGHPYSFSLKTIRQILRSQFEIVREEAPDWASTKVQATRSGKLRELVKVLLGIMEFDYVAVCRNRVPGNPRKDKQQAKDARGAVRFSPATNKCSPGKGTG